MTTRLIRIVAVATFLLPLFGNFPAYGATWVDERLVLIQQELATAREMRSLGQPGYGDLLRRSAAGLARLGHTGEAIQVLDEVIASPETDLDRPSALRQLGQYRLRQGRTADAIVAFEQQIAAYDAQPELITRFPAGFASGVSQSSELLSLSGRVEEAIVMNERLLGTHRSSFQAAVLSDAMARKSRLLQRKGENAAAVQAIDELFLAYPEYGRDNGAAILLRMSRARLVDPTKRSNEYVAALRDLWDDPRYSGALGTLDVGLELVRVRNERHEAEESLQAAMSVVQRIDARREAWLQEEPNNVQIGRVIRRAEKTALVRLQSGSSAGRRDLTIYALQRLILGAETHELRENLQSQLNFVMQQP